MHTKHTLIIVAGISLIAGIAYMNFSGNEEIDTNTQHPILSNTNIKSQTSTIQIPTTQIETDTGKRLTTYATGNTAWGISPFGSGKPLEETANTHTGVFKQPNTEWKTRTLSGITYVFGEGNPEVIQSKLDHAYNPQYTDGVTVRPETEKFLAEFLSNPMLVTVVNQCGMLIRSRGDNLSSPLEVGLPHTLFTTDFSLESMITIDPSTGEKVLDRDRFDLFGIMFDQVGVPVSEDSNIPWNIKLHCFDPRELPSYQKLMYQYGHANMSWYNGSATTLQP